MPPREIHSTSSLLSPKHFCQKRGKVFSFSPSLLVTTVLWCKPTDCWPPMSLRRGDRQMNVNWTVFFVFGDEIFCNLEGLKQRLSRSKEIPTPALQILHPFDRLLPSSYQPLENTLDNQTVVVYLYSSLSSSVISEFVSYAQQVQNFEPSTGLKVKFVLRYLPPNDERKIFLQGFGTGLTFKNVEYKAVDDSKKEEKENEEAKTEEVELNEVEEIEGFNFAKIIKRKPQLKSELLLFRDSLLSSKTNEEFHQLKPWHIKDIGIQACQRILQSSNPLRTLRDLSQNFPSFASSLSKLAINATMKQSITKAHMMSGFTEGSDFVLFNGMVIDTEELDPFKIYDLIQDETAKYNKLRNLFLTPNTVRSILSVPLSLDVPVSRRYDIRTNLVNWANDLESDMMYSQWPDSVKDILRPNYYGQPYFIAKNLVNIVVGINLGSDEGLNILGYLARLIFQQAPARFGLVFTTKGKPGQEEVASVMAKLFSVSKTKLGLHATVNAFAMYWNSIDTVPSDVEALDALYKSFHPQQAAQLPVLCVDTLSLIHI
eukprot:TRINITY_DN7547_c0_g1_i1.p1 TRINITY_DN7547_c0_g1~~TRINITY_DN7547_c0_g1_i1.p1  ORF type:complete len:543 (+),score=171.85 TRINITY_DN7547_c0_g1_i1:303-1931(+)